MLENLFTNVFGRPKSKSGGRNTQHDTSGTSSSQITEPAQMTGPFSMSTPQMPQPPNLPYPPAPYPSSSYYPPLPFSQPPSIPQHSYSDDIPTSIPSQISPLDSVPFEAKINFSGLDQLFKEIKRVADVVDKAKTYLGSSQSDYNFKTEQEVIDQ